LKGRNALKFIPRTGLDRAVVDLTNARVEQAWINRDLNGGTFLLGCALARTGRPAVDLRRRLLAAKVQVGRCVQSSSGLRP